LKALKVDAKLTLRQDVGSGMGHFKTDMEKLNSSTRTENESQCLLTEQFGNFTEDKSLKVVYSITFTARTNSAATLITWRSSHSLKIQLGQVVKEKA
jgi:hypothetical protein